MPHIHDMGAAVLYVLGTIPHLRPLGHDWIQLSSILNHCSCQVACRVPRYGLGVQRHVPRAMRMGMAIQS